MTTDIQITSRTLSPEELYRKLASAARECPDLHFELRQPTSRGVDASVVVAIVSSLSTLIVAALGIAQSRAATKIVITGQGRVEVPVGTSREDIEYYVRKAIELKGTTIVID